MALEVLPPAQVAVSSKTHDDHNDGSNNDKSHDREPSEPINNRIYVGNLGYEISEPDLFYYFAEFGAVHRARIIHHSRGGFSKSYGFVTFHSPTTVKKLLESPEKENMWLKGRKLLIGVARLKPARYYRARGGQDRGRVCHDYVEDGQAGAPQLLTQEPQPVAYNEYTAAASDTWYTRNPALPPCTGVSPIYPVYHQPYPQHPGQDMFYYPQLCPAQVPLPTLYDVPPYQYQYQAQVYNQSVPQHSIPTETYQESFVSFVAPPGILYLPSDKDAAMWSQYYGSGPESPQLCDSGFQESGFDIESPRDQEQQQEERMQITNDQSTAKINLDLVGESTTKSLSFDECMGGVVTPAYPSSSRDWVKNQVVPKMPTVPVSSEDNVGLWESNSRDCRSIKWSILKRKPDDKDAADNSNVIPNKDDVEGSVEKNQPEPAVQEVE